MNPVALIDPDILLVFAAVSASFLLGCVLRLVRGVAQQRFEVAHTGADLRDLIDRCDQQHSRFKRIQDEIQQLNTAMHQNAALAQTSVAVRTPAPATGAAPEATAAVPEKVDPLRLARSGADVETLMSRCKLSRAEAELVCSVHGAGSAKAA